MWSSWLVTSLLPRLAARLATHAAAARAQSVSVAGLWLSQPITSASQVEQQIIGFCAGRFQALTGLEYFADADAGDVLAFAETLELRMAPVVIVPGKSGRPEIGPKWEVRLFEETRAEVEALVEKDGVKRGEVLRRLIEEALAAREASA